MIYSFDTELAAEIGLNEAILLQNIAYWVKKNEANDVNFHDGCYWTYNSASAFAKLYPFWTPRVIKYALAKLQKADYIKTAQYNKDKMNHTNWYTLTTRGWWLILKYNPHQQQEHEQEQQPIVQNESIDGTKLSHRRYKNDFPTIYTNNKHTNGKHKDARASCPFDNPSDELKEAWEGFVEMRKAGRKTFTERAAKLIANKVEKIAQGDDAMKAAILNQSVERGWQGVFPLKDEKQDTRRGAPPGGQQSAQDMYEEGLEIMRKGGLI